MYANWNKSIRGCVIENILVIDKGCYCGRRNFGRERGEQDGK